MLMSADVSNGLCDWAGTGVSSTSESSSESEFESESDLSQTMWSAFWGLGIWVGAWGVLAKWNKSATSVGGVHFIKSI